MGRTKLAQDGEKWQASGSIKCGEFHGQPRNHSLCLVVDLSVCQSVRT